MKNILLPLIPAACLASPTPIDPDLILTEKDGNILIEAESFIKQEQKSARAWHITTSKNTPTVRPDYDPSHVKGASGEAYVEALPDKAQPNHDEQVSGETYSNTPGETAVLSYRVQFENAGRYYCWVRAYHSKTGSDDSLHLGLDRSWPDSGKFICLPWHYPHGWNWSSQRHMANGNGFGQVYLDVEKPGLHTIKVSMREDGSELDQIYLSQQDPHKHTPPNAHPPSKGTPNTESIGSVKPPSRTPNPAPKLPHISVPEAECDINTREDDGSRILTSNDFPTGKAYLSNNSRFMELNLNAAHSADTSVSFPYPSKSYYVSLSYVLESSSSVSHHLQVNGKTVLTCEAPKTNSGSFKKANKRTSKKIRIRKGSTITVKTAVTDGINRHSKGGRWELLRFSTD